jgi:hypothetical protein
VRALLDVNRFGGVVTTENIFEFEAGLNQEPGAATVALEISDDLRPLARVESIGGDGTFGARLLPFTTRNMLGVLDPGTSFEIDYSVRLADPPVPDWQRTGEAIAAAGRILERFSLGFRKRLSWR